VPGIVGYAAEFLFPQRDQPLLLPVDMREWLPEDDLVFIVLAGAGRPAGAGHYHDIRHARRRRLEPGHRCAIVAAVTSHVLAPMCFCPTAWSAVRNTELFQTRAALAATFEPR
jgi:hypothetical protein